jgi:hypothetical protein
LPSPRTRRSGIVKSAVASKTPARRPKALAPPLMALKSKFDWLQVH